MQPSFPVVLLSILYVQYTELSIQKKSAPAPTGIITKEKKGEKYG